MASTMFATKSPSSPPSFSPHGIAQPSYSSTTRNQAGDSVRGPSKARNRIKVLLVDDHPVVRKGISCCLARHPQLLVVGEAADGVEALAKARELLPDIVLLDIDLPQISGLVVADLLRKELPNTKVLILSMYRRARVPAACLASRRPGLRAERSLCRRTGEGD